MKFGHFKKMKIQLFFYSLGFIILLVTNSNLNNLNNDPNYQLATFKRCIEKQQQLKGDLKKCL